MPAMKSVLAGAVTLTLSACATVPAQPYPFGAATAHNKAVHAIAPTPAQKADTHIPADPARQRMARDAYRTDQVEEPDVISTMGGEN